jgi:hypothetical protein
MLGDQGESIKLTSKGGWKQNDHYAAAPVVLSKASTYLIPVISLIPTKQSKLGGVVIASHSGVERSLLERTRVGIIQWGIETKYACRCQSWPVF